MMTTNLPIHRIAEEPVTNTGLDAVSYSFLLAMLPHFLNLPLWISGFALFALTWRLLQARARLREVPKWVLVPLVLVGGVSVFAQYWTIVGREPGLALLTVMTGFKFLESRTHRDILILIFLCYFLLATHFLFSQSIPIALYMFAVLIVITATLMSINQRDDSVAMIDRLKSSGRLVLSAIPIMMLLFVLVPRIPGPIWGITQEQRGGVTGLSESMSPGQISNLITSNEVAFRVNFEDSIPEQGLLYWRGPVMVDYNRGSWRQAKHYVLKRMNIRDAGMPVRYTVTLEPHGKHWLFGLDMPVRIIPGSYMSSEYQFTSKKPINDLKRYTLDSRLEFRVGLEEPLEYLLQASTFPEVENPRTLALGEQWADRYDNPVDIINQALHMFRSDEFVYTLQPPLLGSNPSDEFLFRTRRGFCEHYASSFALLMRAAGIPARVVTGYQGGEVNELGGYLIVRQSDAHAWTEVWLDDRGWVRIDPTAAVSPDRIENGLDQALPDVFATFKIGQRSPVIGRLLFGWDNMKKTWNDWVLNYDQRKQESFLHSLGLGIRTWGDMIITLVITMVALLAVYGLISWYRDRPPRPVEFETIMNAVLKKLARAGFRRRPSEALSEFVARIDVEHQQHDRQLERIVDAYTRIKYAKGYGSDAVLRSFRRMVAEWKSRSTERVEE